MVNVLRDIVARNRSGGCVAIPSVCSAHPEVLASSLQLAAKLNRPIVIEATSNQVNQFGGYTGMNAADYVLFVADLIAESKVDPSLVILGGDHLGPQVWKSESAESAMTKANVLVADYARAGIRKIHLDCSEGCAGEPAQVDDWVAATRAAELAIAARDACDDSENLVFVVGTEVPPPGGARIGDDGQIAATTRASAKATLAAHQLAFEKAGIADLWPQVAGLVVQPGVEFGPDEIHHLPLDRDPGLRAAVAEFPAICLEAHSTDYQSPDVFPKLAELGFAFQKVGPALTYAWREALYSLDQILAVLRPDLPRLAHIIESEMNLNTAYIDQHYPLADKSLWHFSYADRIRYYWPLPSVNLAVANLLAEFDGLGLSDYALETAFAPNVLARSQGLANSRGLALARAQVQVALEPYLFEVSRD